VVDGASGVRKRHRRRRSRSRAHLDRLRPAWSASDAAQPRPFHADHDRRGRGPLAAQLHCPPRAVVAPAAFGDRRLAHRRSVRLAVRHHPGRHAQPRQIRPRLLCRTDLQPLRREFRPGRASCRQCRAASQLGTPPASTAPEGGLRPRALCRARTAVQRRRGVFQGRHHREGARRHHHGLEQGRRRSVRIFRGGSHRPAHLDHRPAGPLQRGGRCSRSGRPGRGDRSPRNGAAAQGRPQGGGLAEHLPGPIGRGRHHRCVRNRARCHRKQADAIGARSRDRGAPAHFRNLAGFDPGERFGRTPDPGQSERDDHSRLPSRRNGGP
jgi:hypothetical protein